MSEEKISKDILIEKKAMAFDLIRRRDALMMEVNSLNRTISKLAEEISAMEQSLSKRVDDSEE